MQETRMRPDMTFRTAKSLLHKTIHARRARGNHLAEKKGNALISLQLLNALVSWPGPSRDALLKGYTPPWL